MMGVFGGTQGFGVRRPGLIYAALIAVLILATFVFASAALAQETTTDEATTAEETRTPAEAREKERSDISAKANSTSSSKSSDRQAQQAAPNDEQEPSAAQDQYQGDGCIPITTLQGNTSKETEPFGIGDTTLRIVFDTEPTTNGRFDFNSTDISVVDADNFTTIDSVTANNGRDGMFEVPLESGRYFVEASTFKQSYKIVVEAAGGGEPCTGDQEGATPETPSPGNPENPGNPSDPGGVEEGTIPNQPLPETGGLPLVGLVVLGLALLGVGSSIVRAGIGRRS